jgi:Adenylate and Guanylate cyclase catalytic domain
MVAGCPRKNATPSARCGPIPGAYAVRAALTMCDTLHEYNEELARDGLPPLALGIGIHSGPGLSGMIGSRERREYGFVGRTVNLAARVQTLTRLERGSTCCSLPDPRREGYPAGARQAHGQDVQQPLGPYLWQAAKSSRSRMKRNRTRWRRLVEKAEAAIRHGNPRLSHSTLILATLGILCVSPM